MTELLARLNPELLRGWRAEATRLRLAITLLLTLGVAWCIQLAWDWTAVGRAGAVAFAIFSFVVTPVRVVGAIADEHNRHTWQRQRMSALSPTQLMLGKAFGATALTDLAALCALLCWALGTYLPGENLAALGPVPAEALQEMAQRLRESFPLDAWLMVCANLLARFLALALAIRNCDRSKAARGRSFVVAILLALLLCSPLTVLKEGLGRGGAPGLDTAPLWFGFVPMDHDAFWAISGLAFVAFVACWCWCAARETLGAGRFALEAVVVGAGFGLWWSGVAWAGVTPFALLDPEYGPLRFSTAALLLVLAATAYLWGVAERVDRRRAREFVAAPNLRTAPAWVLVALLAAVTVAVHVAAGLFSQSGSLGFMQQNFWAVSLLGFLLRDMAILFLVLTSRVRRWPELAALASWLVLGLFVPGALAGAGAMAGGFELRLLFTPIAVDLPTAHLLIAALSAWLQAGLAIAWLHWRSRARNS